MRRRSGGRWTPGPARTRPPTVTPPAVGAQEARDDAQQGRLAAAGRAEHRGQGAARDGEVEPVEDGRRVRAVGLAQSLDAQVTQVRVGDLRFGRASFGRAWVGGAWVAHVRCLPRR